MRICLIDLFVPPAATIRLNLLGSPTIEFAGASVALPVERRGQLIALLALKRAWIPRSELATMFWPDQTTKLANANLRKIVFRLQALPHASGIEVEGAALRFVADTDVADFDAALRDGRVSDALALRRGELLAGLDDYASEAWTSWLNFERDRLRTAWRAAALQRLATEIDAGEGIELSARLLDADPLDEAALRAHMQWLAQDGQGARARQAYQAFVRRLAADLGLAPGADLKSLHDALGAGSAAKLQRAVVAAGPAEDSFVGRSIELRRLGELLAQDDCPLVSVVGPGGMGKTRFARHASVELGTRFADGTVFVPLEDVATKGEFGSRMARELGIGVAGSAVPLAKVISYLRDRQMLIVLDNFEQLVAEAPLVGELLQACPRTKFIVTSRVRLALPGEWLLRLDGLPCPEPDDQDHIEAFDAARLFVKAAHRVEPALLPAMEAASIVEICNLVEGLPLALELAAAWTRVLSCEAIVAELRRGTELLSTADAAHPARHASIEAVFEQSWRLLTPIEREVLAKLAVFRGGFTNEAARAVAGAALPVLGALADKSLLRKDDTRIHLHSLVQQFAATRLEAGGSAADTAAKHAQYYGRLMVQSKHAAETGERESIAQLDAEFENCRAAWHWAVAHAANEMLLQCKSALINYCDHRARHDDMLALLNEALGSPAVRAHPVLEARLLARAAHLRYRLDRYAEAESGAIAALAVARTARDYGARSLCLNVLGSCCLKLGRFDDALRYYEQGLQLATAKDDLHNAAATLDHIAMVQKWLGRYDEALRHSLQSLDTQRRLGDVAGEALCLNNLASLHLARQDYASAEPCLSEGLAICDREGLVSTRMYILGNLTEVALRAGDNAAAASYTARGIESANALGNRGLVSWFQLQSTRLALLRGDLPAARTELATSLATTMAIGQSSLKMGSVMIFTEVLEAQREADIARRVLAFAAAHPATSAPDREEMQGRLAGLPALAGAEPAWPGIELDDLIQRIIAEADVAYSPLLALLRDAR